MATTLHHNNHVMDSDGGGGGDGHPDHVDGHESTHCECINGLVVDRNNSQSTSSSQSSSTTTSSAVESAAKRCGSPSCIGSDIQAEDGMLVCVNCGQTYCQSQFRNDPTQEFAVNVRPDQTKTYLNGCRTGGGVRSGHPIGTAPRYKTLVLEALVSSLSLGPRIKDQAIEKYKTMICGAFRCASLDTKRVLSAICVYIALIDDKNAVTIGHVCNATGCTTGDFNRVFNQVIKEYPELRPEKMSIESLVPVVLSEANVAVNERKILEEKVLKVLELERECWLIEGRTPVHIIYAAAYLAWKSIKPYDRRKVRLTEFCRQMDIAYKHTTCERVNELMKAITRLADKLVRPREGSGKTLTINKSNIGIHLDRVLDYQSSLIFDYNQHLKRQFVANGMDGDDGEEDNPDYKCGDWINAFKTQQRKKAKTVDERPRDEKPVVYNEKGEVVIEDMPFEDNEIERYLRSEKEVKMIKKLKEYSDPCDETHN